MHCCRSDSSSDMAWYRRGGARGSWEGIPHPAVEALPAGCYCVFTSGSQTESNWEQKQKMTWKPPAEKSLSSSLKTNMRIVCGNWSYWKTTKTNWSIGSSTNTVGSTLSCSLHAGIAAVAFQTCVFSCWQRLAVSGANCKVCSQSLGHAGRGRPLATVDPEGAFVWSGNLQCSGFSLPRGLERTALLKPISLRANNPKLWDEGQGEQRWCRRRPGKLQEGQ